MVQRFLGRPGLFLRSVLLGTALFSTAFSGVLHADPTITDNEVRAAHNRAAIEAYRKRVNELREQSYKERKTFPPLNEAVLPPPVPSTEKNEAPVQIGATDPNRQQQAPTVRVAAPGSPEYERLSRENLRPAKSQSLRPVPELIDQKKQAAKKPDTLFGHIASLFSSEPDTPVEKSAVVQNENAAYNPLVEYVSDGPGANAGTTATEAPKHQYDHYKSPGIVIKRTRIQMPLTPDVIASATPEQLAAFAPAAGGDTADGVTAPLIQPGENTGTELPVTALPPMPDPPAPMVPLVETPATNEADVERMEHMIESTPIEPLTTPLDATKQSSTSTENSQAAPGPTVSEPPASLSKNSEKIINKLKPIADEVPRQPKGLSMDRSKDTSDALDAEVGVAEHEAEGVKIKVKTPAINNNYELEKAYAALISGESQGARILYQRVLDNDPNNVDALFGLATLYHRAHQLDDARPLYGKILAINPSHREALNNFLVLLADEAPEAALEQLEQLEKKSPDFSPIPAQMAIIYQKLGKLEEATQKMFRAVALAPENLTYRYNLAVMLDSQGNAQEAIRLYQDLLLAHTRGEAIPGDVNKVQERLTFLRSNSP